MDPEEQTVPAEQAPAPALVDIEVDGRPATVPQADLRTALDAGAKLPAAPEEPSRGFHDYLEQGVQGLISAQHGLTGGLGTAGVVKLREALEPGSRQGIVDELHAGEEKFPLTTAAGRMGGMVLGSIGLGKAIGWAGKAAGLAPVAETALGWRLAGHAASAMGQQSGYNVAEQLSEDSLGDVATNGEKLLAAATNKDVLFAGAAGLTLGGIGELYKAMRPASAGLLGGLERARGPTSDAIADQVAGMPGAGRAVTREAGEATAFIDEASRAGMPNAEARQLWGDIGHATQEGSVGGDAARAVADAHAEWVAKGNPEMAEVIQRGASNRALRMAEQDGIIDTHARAFKAASDDALRNVTDVADEVQFRFKPEQVKRLVPTHNLAEQIDEGLRIRQRIGEVMDFWGDTAAKGGAEGNLKTLGKMVKDFDRANSKIVMPTTEAGIRALAAENYLRLDGMRKAVSPLAKFGKSPYGLPEIAMHPTHGGDVLYHEIQQALQNEQIFGKMGAAQAGNNAAFSNSFTVRKEFTGEFGTVLQHELGRPITEIDSKPTRSFLSGIGDSGADTKKKVVQGFIDGERNRIAAIREHYDMSPAQAAKLAKGEASLNHMEKTVAGAVREAEIVSKIKLQMASEAGHGLGGMFGLVTDLVNRPMAAQSKLRDIAEAMDHVTKTGKSAVNTALDWTAPSSPYRGKAPPPHVTAAEIDGVKAAAKSPEVMAARVHDMVGTDLHQAAPKIATATAATAARAVAYLATKAPIGSSPIGMIPGKAVRRYTDAELSQWHRDTDAVKHPTQVIADAKHGRFTREGMQALETVYPNMFEELRGYMRTKLADMDRKGLLKDMPYEQKQVISRMLHIPVDDTQRGDFIAMMQQSKMAPAPGQSQGGQGGGAPHRGPLKVDSKSYDPNPERTQ